MISVLRAYHNDNGWPFLRVANSDTLEAAQ